MTLFLDKIFSRKISLIYALCISVLFLSSCQKAEPQQMQEQPQTHSAEPDQIVDLSALCQNIEKNMANINAERTTFALEQINQDLKLCLPLSSFAQQKHFLTLSNQMYDHFLAVDRTPAEQSAFENYAFDLSQHPTLQQSHFEQLNLRDQYLLKHKGQAYIELLDEGNGQLSYRRSPEYLAKVFAPYMPPAEQVFIENLAAQNLLPVFAGQSLMIDPHEIVSRALFWEDYLKQYPKSSYAKDATYLLHTYSVFLFEGLPDSAVSESYLDEYAIQSSSLDEIKQLAQLKNSNLALKANKFLQFLQLSPEQRLKQIPVPLSAKEQQSGAENLRAAKQLEQYLALQPLNLSKIRDCFRDAICRTD